MKKYATAIFYASSPLLAMQEMPFKYISKEIDITGEHPNVQICNESLELRYISRANEHLLSQNYAAAIAAYEQAETMPASAEDSGVAFLIAFGKAIACDHLKQNAKKKEAFSQLYALSECSDLQEQAEELPADLLEQNEIAQGLLALAHNSLSPETRIKLSLLVYHVFSSSEMGKIYEQSSPSLYQERLRIQCRKSFWKRIEKLAHNIYKCFKKIQEIVDWGLDTRDRLGDQRIYIKHSNAIGEN